MAVMFALYVRLEAKKARLEKGGGPMSTPRPLQRTRAEGYLANGFGILCEKPL